MTSPSTTWDMVRIYGTWHGMDGKLLDGSYTVQLPARVTDTTDDVIIPAGNFASNVPLVSTGSGPSLDFMCPATDDPDIAETGWKVAVTVKFSGGQAGEKYVIDVPYANRPTVSGGSGLGVNLRTVALSASIPQQNPLYKVGVAGGLATLNADGEVVDADGTPVTGGTASISADAGNELTTGTDGGLFVPEGGAVTSANITDATTVGKSVLTAADAATARTAISAGTSDLAIGTTSTTAKAGDYQPASANISDATNIGKVLLTAADAAAARTVIGAGTSNLALGTSSTTALAGNTAIPSTAADVGAVPTTRAVAGHALSADVTLAKADVGLGSVDNTADAVKSVASAAKLTTARAINGVAFDGTASITVADATKVPTTRTVNGKALSANVTLAASDVGAATTAQGAKADSAVQPASLAAVATSGSAADLAAGLLSVARASAGSVLGVHYDTGSSSWPARPTARTDVTVNYYAATATDPAPADFVAGTDYLYQPQS